METAFVCELATAADTAIVRVRGELDIATAPTFDFALREAAVTGLRTLVLDLREVTFIDSSAMQVLITGKEIAEQHGLELEIMAGDGPVRRLLEITKLSNHLHLLAGNPGVLGLEGRNVTKPDFRQLSTPLFCEACGRAIGRGDELWWQLSDGRIIHATSESQRVMIAQWQSDERGKGSRFYHSSCLPAA
jgi:anti-anti-sigma factor